MNQTISFMSEIGDAPDNEMFLTIDTNGDGKIVQEELSQYFDLIGMNHSQKDLDDIYKEVDINNDKSISSFEFNRALQRNLSLIKTKPNTDYNRPMKPTTDLEKLFDQIDIDMNEKLTPEEVFMYMESNGATYNASDVTDFWTIADRNRDGNLTFKEIKKALKNEKKDHTVSLAYSKNQKVNLIFYYYDIDKNNYLDKTEVQKILSDAYGMTSDSDAQWFLSQLDNNYDQKLSWEEIAAVVQ